MKSKLIIIFLSAFIVNIGNLDAFALEEKTQVIKSIDKANSNIYQVENNSNMFLSQNTDSDFSISFSSESKSSTFNENDWILSFLFPGYGQYALGENDSGNLFIILSGITALFTLAIVIVALAVNQLSPTLLLLFFGVPFALVNHLTVYILNIVNAYSLSEQKKASNNISLGRKKAT